MTKVNPRPWPRPVAAALMALAALTGCGHSATKDVSISAASGAAPVPDRPAPVDNPTGRQVRIAVLAAPPSAAEFFKAPYAGVQRAQAVLGHRGARIDFVPLTDYTASGVNSALRTAITQKYDAIEVSLRGEANCAPVQEATRAGIKVGVVISTADCAQAAGAAFVHGEQSYDTWKTVVAPGAITATGGRPCRVGVITGDFNVPAHEARRTGFLDGIAGSALTPVDKGVAAGFDPAKFQAAARDYTTANPDLCALIVTVGDNGAAAAALTADQARKVRVLSADLTTGDVQQIKTGRLFGTFTQDPFGETYDSTVWLYNELITGNGPPGGFQQPVKDTFVSAANVDAAVHAQNTGQ